MPVNGQILAILRGGIAPPSMHETLARTLLGTVLGTLVVDAMLSDDRILQACRVAIEQRELSLATMHRDLPPELRGETPHQDLAYKVIRVAAQELSKGGFMDLCERMLAQIRIAAGDPEVRRKILDAQQAAVDAKPRSSD